METRKKKQTQGQKNLYTMTLGGFVIVEQLNEYHTDPYFIKLSQSMTADCLLI